ncbi:hypothetical protein LCGC14_1743640 [marine sediment metagenome]|uniref:Uncharacterized protein n=1 Tax=marine sediment metagenome TaxID=412755 RepID=A0A0F9K5J7_9ZZZZ
MSEDVSLDYEELLELGEKAGISDLIEVYGEIQEDIDLFEEYLREFESKFYLSTTNFTYVLKDE